MKTTFFLIVFLMLCGTAWCDSYYALTAHVSKNKNLLVTVTKTPNEVTCEKVLALKRSDDPMGNGMWHPESAECHGPTDAAKFEPTFNKQPIYTPYAWFVDKDGFETVFQVMDVHPSLATTFIKALAAQIRNWGIEVTVILPKVNES